jgi:hypothetical protein
MPNSDAKRLKFLPRSGYNVSPVDSTDVFPESQGTEAYSKVKLWVMNGKASDTVTCFQHSYVMGSHQEFCKTSNDVWPCHLVTSSCSVTLTNFITVQFPPVLNPSAQRCLTKFLLGILLLELCISFIYAWKPNKCNNYSFSLLIM